MKDRKSRLITTNSKNTQTLSVALASKGIKNWLLCGDVYLTYVALVAVYVLLQGDEQTLSMLRGEHHAALITCLG